MVSKEIRAAKKKKPSGIIVKMNSLTDSELINLLYTASRVGVPVQMVIRGICGAYTQQKSFKEPMKAISIIDEYLEHARVFIFHNGGEERVYISSADWMVRNLDHRVEAACPIYDPLIRQELMDIVNIQLAENVKARILDNEQSNTYVERHEHEPEVRSQEATYEYLQAKTYES